MKWRFIDTGEKNASYNMALDEAIFTCVEKGISPPAVRLYRWNPGAISLGYSQKAGSVLDIEKCVTDQIDITRRLTGGRAVFHDEEVTYSLSGGVDDPFFGGSIIETYRKISEVLCAAIRDVGVDAELNRGTVPQESKTYHMSPCFVSTAKYEITVAGKKIVGSAQHRLKNCFLQHGSILTGTAHKKIIDYLSDKRLIEKMRFVLDEKSTDIGSALNGSFVSGDLVESLKKEFFNRLGTGIFESEPTEEENVLAGRLMEKYLSKGWVFNNER